MWARRGVGAHDARSITTPQRCCNSFRACCDGGAGCGFCFATLEVFEHSSAPSATLAERCLGWRRVGSVLAGTDKKDEKAGFAVQCALPCARGRGFVNVPLWMRKVWQRLRNDQYKPARLSGSRVNAFNMALLLRSALHPRSSEHAKPTEFL